MVYFIKGKPKYLDYHPEEFCFEKCPNNTSHDENDFLCKDIDVNKYLLSENEFKSLNENITDKEIEKFVKNYEKEFK